MRGAPACSLFLALYLLFVSFACANSSFQARISVAPVSSCDDANGTLSAQCLNMDKSKPYCISSSCVQCNSWCDCPFDQYCSSNPSTFKQCVPFGMGGQSCLPMTEQQLVDPGFPSNLKCAITFKDAKNNTQVDHFGVCLEGTCRLCNPWDQERNVVCLGQTVLADGKGVTTGGLRGARACVAPGTFVPPGSKDWSPASYFGSPLVVWLTFTLGAVIAVAISSCGIWHQSLKSPYAQLQ